MSVSLPKICINAKLSQFKTSDNYYALGLFGGTRTSDDTDTTQQNYIIINKSNTYSVIASDAYDKKYTNWEVIDFYNGIIYAHVGTLENTNYGLDYIYSISATVVTTK